jgi:steroid 5-alpha reductase family enzyme
MVGFVDHRTNCSSRLGIIGPIIITFLILKVSGIPMLEKKMEENPDFAEYKRRVSVFFSLMIKKK